MQCTVELETRLCIFLINTYIRKFKNTLIYLLCISYVLISIYAISIKIFLKRFDENNFNLSFVNKFLKFFNKIAEYNNLKYIYA